MIRNIIIITCLLFISPLAECQVESEINKSDQLGRKQGHWIKKYPDQSVMYDGFFKDNHPVGEFRRYNEDATLKSLLVYSADGKEAVASIYHSNGFIASRGKYVNQQKEGKWQFFSISIDGYMISEEYYSGNLKNGPSVKFYPDGTVAESINYIKNIKQGEWKVYYPDGSICLKSNYRNNKIDGLFEVWYENGNIEFSGLYKNDVRDGEWLIFNSDGSLKYKIEYHDGVTKDRQMDIDESDFLDTLEKNKGKFADPEKTGVINK
jgi:antitoxin component YwqK of YwqJK toxin-antitoxin module